MLSPDLISLRATWVKRPSIPAVLLAMSMVPWVFAQEPGAPSPLGDRTRDDIKEGVTRLLLTDESFVKKSVRSNEIEVELATLALENSTNPRIKTFAERMVKDHGAVLNTLRSIAHDKDITLPSNADYADNATRQLRGLSGVGFDTAYAKLVRERHHNALTLFHAASDDTSLDPELRRFARSTLVILLDHQHQAETLPGHDHNRASGL